MASNDDPARTDPMVRPRYTGLASFMRMPYRSLDQGGWDGVEIGLIGGPFDGGVTNRPGARHGPREIRNQSSFIRKINQATGIAPHDLCTVADLGDAWIEKPFELKGALDEIAAFFAQVHAQGITPLSAGGDHAITLPILRAIAHERPLGLIHFDAHCDTGDDYLGSKLHHGVPFRRAVEEGLLDPKRCIQIGIRGSVNELDQWAFSHEQGMRVIYIEEFYELGVAGVIAEAQRVIGTGPAYVSFDVDGLDPVYAPGTGTPEVGGFSTLEAQLMLRGLSGLDLVGGDVVEVSPPFDPTGNTALVGATMMFEILCLLAEARAAR